MTTIQVQNDIRKKNVYPVGLSYWTFKFKTDQQTRKLTNGGNLWEVKRDAKGRYIY